MVDMQVWWCRTMTTPPRILSPAEYRFGPFQIPTVIPSHTHINLKTSSIVLKLFRKLDESSSNFSVQIHYYKPNNCLPCLDLFLFASMLMAIYMSVCCQDFYFCICLLDGCIAIQLVYLKDMTVQKLTYSIYINGLRQLVKRH